MPTYRVYIIVSECILFKTVFYYLNLDFNLKRHYPSWGTSAYFPRGTSAWPHLSKCCIMIIIIMRLYSNTVLHVRARMGARVCAFMCVCLAILIYILEAVNLKGGGLAPVSPMRTSHISKQGRFTYEIMQLGDSKKRRHLSRPRSVCCSIC